MGYMLSTNKQYENGVSAMDAALDNNALFTPKKVAPSFLTRRKIRTPSPSTVSTQTVLRLC